MGLPPAALCWDGAGAPRFSGEGRRAMRHFRPEGQQRRHDLENTGLSFHQMRPSLPRRGCRCRRKRSANWRHVARVRHHGNAAADEAVDWPRPPRIVLRLEHHAMAAAHDARARRPSAPSSLIPTDETAPAPWQERTRATRPRPRLRRRREEPFRRLHDDVDEVTAAVEPQPRLAACPGRRWLSLTSPLVLPPHPRPLVEDARRRWPRPAHR